MKKYVFSLIIIIGLMLLYPGVNSSGEINIVGSTSIQPVCEDLVEEYRKSHQNVTVNIQGGGSNLGIKSVESDIADIGMCSKEINGSYDLHQYELGREGIIVAVNPSNNIDGLKSDEIRRIFSGDITDWDELGGENSKINVFVREEGSGTLDAFKEKIMNGSEIKSDAIVLNSAGSLKQSIAQDENAIGFVSYSYLDSDVKALNIDGIYPDDDTIADGRYILQRPFLLLFKNESNDFIKWIESGEASEILKQNKIINGG